MRKVFHHPSVMIKRLGDGKCGQMQAARFAALCDLQTALG
jgi:hypothetical protein